MNNTVLYICIYVVLLHYTVNASVDLQFRADHTFKIVQFTDLHYGDKIPSFDDMTTQYQRTILDAEMPDLVLLTGDIVSGDIYPSVYPSSCLSRYPGELKCYAQAVLPMLERNIPWAFTFGNHDRNAQLRGYDIVNNDNQYNLSLTQHSPVSVTGDTNYVLHVNGTFGLDIYMMDSGSYGCMGHAGYGCVDDSQISWYKRQATQRSRYGLMAIHIPPVETLSLSDDNILGYRDDDICCSGYNSGLVQALLDTGNVQTMIFGHGM